MKMPTELRPQELALVFRKNDEEGQVSISKGRLSGLVRKLGFNSAWERHRQQMSHGRYPYYDVHQEALDKYGLNPNYPAGKSGRNFCLWRVGSEHNTIVPSPEQLEEAIRGIYERRRINNPKARDGPVSDYLPHFIAVKNPPVLMYLISHNIECENEAVRALRSSIAKWIMLKKKKEHPDKLYESTQRIENLCGDYLTFWVNPLDRESEEEDKKFEEQVYNYNRERIFRLVDDTSQFCRIVRAEYDWINHDGHNGYRKFENQIGMSLDGLAQSLAYSHDGGRGVMGISSLLSLK